MSRSARLRLRISICLLAIIAVVAPLRSQKTTKSELQNYLRRALEKFGRQRGSIDETALNRLESVFFQGDDFQGDDILDKKQTANRLADALKRNEFSLSRDRDSVFVISSGPPVNPFPEDPLATSSAFVDSVSSLMRRISITDEIHADVSQELGKDQLHVYVQDTLRLPDYATVAASFEPTSTTSLAVFKEETTLLRLYGGGSKPNGRYFFCCLRSVRPNEIIVGRPSGWVDATSLATPPENLFTDLAVAKIPAGTPALIGIVADMFGVKGGNVQIFLPEVPSFPFDHYRLVKENTEASQIRLESDNGRVLWFRQ